MLYAVSLAKNVCSVERSGLLAKNVDDLHVVIVPDLPLNIFYLIACLLSVVPRILVEVATYGRHASFAAFLKSQ